MITRENKNSTVGASREMDPFHFWKLDAVIIEHYYKVDICTEVSLNAVKFLMPVFALLSSSLHPF